MPKSRNRRKNRAAQYRKEQKKKMLSYRHNKSLATKNIVFPICKLLENASSLFEDFCDKYEMKENFEKGLSKVITLNHLDGVISDVAEVRKHYDAENKEIYKIYVWANYCQFLWILCYTSLVFTDNFFRILRFDTKNAESEEFLQESFKLLCLGMKMFNEASNQRPKTEEFYSLPNPCVLNPNKYITAANRLFEISLCFILLHEYGHVDLDHMKKDEEKEDELAADYSAFYSMYNDRDEKERKNIIGGIILSLSSSFFMDDTLKGGTHPDPDYRLSKVLSYVDLDEDALEYSYGLIAIIYKIWAYTYNLQSIFEDKDFIDCVDNIETTKEYFESIKKACDKYKTNQLKM